MLKFALRNLLSRPMRSLLALLGLHVAIAGMVGLFAVAEGLDSMVASTFGRVSGLVVMQPAAPVPLFSRLPARWEADLQAIPGVETVNAEIWQRVNVIEDKLIYSPPRFLVGTDIETRLRLRHGVYQEDVEEGRFLSRDDEGTNNCLISRTVAKEYGVGVGDTLRVERQDLQIVGIYHCGSMLLDLAILMDIDQVRQIGRFGPDVVSTFYVEPIANGSNEQVADRIEQAFLDRRLEAWQPSGLMGMSEGAEGNVAAGLLETLGQGMSALGLGPTQQTNAAETEDGSTVAGSPPTNDDMAANVASTDAENRSALEVRSAGDWTDKINDVSGDLNLALTVMTSIGVIVAVLSIVNTMLMSVTERMIEFGILKANGWSRRDVVRLITCESAILGVSGGLLGCVVGWSATELMNWYWPTRLFLYASPQLLAFAIVFSTLLGVVGGLYPALWAMRMMPMDAIRRG